MMRDILFRGRDVKTSEWVEGFLFTKYYDGIEVKCIGVEPLSANDYGEIYSHNHYEVDPITIGQFTGLLDKNGKRVWEGDIIDIGNGYHGIIIWDGLAWGLQIQEVNHTLYSWSAAVRLTEAISNIHELRGENDGE